MRARITITPRGGTKDGAIYRPRRDFADAAEARDYACARLYGARVRFHPEHGLPIGYGQAIKPQRGYCDIIAPVHVEVREL